jgi:hypothetical protein
MKNVKSLLFVIVVLCFIQANSQYVYFNNTYQSWQGGSGQINVDMLSNYYITFGIGGYYGFEYRKIGYNGISFENADISTPFRQSGWGATGTDVFIHKDSMIVTSSMSFSLDDCASTFIPGCTLLDTSFNTLWTHEFPEWTICDTVYGQNIGFAHVDDTSFVMLSDFAYLNGETSPDSMGWRITRMRYSDGAVLENHRFMSPYASYGLRQVRYSNGYYFVLGEMRPTNGTFSNPPDLQNLLCRVDFDGSNLLELQFGNPDVCYENEPQMRVLPNGDIALSYEKCLDQHPEATSPWPYRHSEPRLAFIDHQTFTPYMDTSYELPLMDLWNLGLYTSAMLIDDQGKILVVEHTWNQETTYFDLTNMISNIGHILRFNEDGTLDWHHQHTPPVVSSDEYYDAPFIYDIIQTADGGYIGTGVAFDQSQQLHWLLKLDNCGYEQPSGCPAVVSTDDEETKISSDIQLWPNPCHNILKAMLPVDAASVRLYDQTGRVVLEEKVYYPNQEWNVSALECGVYVLEVVREEGGTLTNRIVKR